MGPCCVVLSWNILDFNVYLRQNLFTFFYEIVFVCNFNNKIVRKLK